MISIVDYGVGNIQAFVNIYKNLNEPCTVVNSVANLNAASKIILPGVGAFDHAMAALLNSGMKDCLDDLVLEKKVPILGICVGMQMLAQSSDEGGMSGLGWIPGRVKKIQISQLPLPHMGWNSIHRTQENILLEGMSEKLQFYFLHSYCFEALCADDVLAESFYGETFHSVVCRENIYGIQCHPEKSHQNGIALLKNFGELRC